MCVFVVKVLRMSGKKLTACNLMGGCDAVVSCNL
jgi:hypothetical protein